MHRQGAYSVVDYHNKKDEHNEMSAAMKNPECPFSSSGTAWEKWERNEQPPTKFYIHHGSAQEEPSHHNDPRLVGDYPEMGLIAALAPKHRERFGGQSVTWATLSGLVVLTKQLNSDFRTTLSSICNVANALESVERKVETLLGEDTPHTIQRAERVKAALSSSEADIAEMQAHQDIIKQQSATQHSELADLSAALSANTLASEQLTAQRLVTQSDLNETKDQLNMIVIQHKQLEQKIVMLEARRCCWCFPLRFS
jgi:hypothetical protein